MVKEEKKPYGYIYKATNEINGKNYIGKTTKTVEKRWDKHVSDAKTLQNKREADPDKKISGKHLENAIAKYGPEVFSVTQIDVAYSKAELNEKEKFWVKEYDSMNREKGYNMTEGGEGGKPSPELLERMTEINREITQRPEYRQKMREIMKEKAKDPIWRENVSKGVSKKYREDPDYKQRQTQERRERAKGSQWRENMTDINQARAKDLNWREKMTRINRERAKDPEYRRKMSEIMKEKAKDPSWRENVSKGVSRKYQEDPDYKQRQTQERRERAKNPEWIQKMRDINRDKRKEIKDKREFLTDVKEKVPKKEMLTKYGMGKNTFTKRIQEMFGPDGPKNYTELKNHLQDKNVNDVLKDIDNRNGERQDNSRENTSEEIKKETSEESKENTIDNESGEVAESDGKMETKEPSGSGLQVGDLISIENIDGNNYVVVHDPTNPDEQTPDGGGDSKERDEDPVDSGVDDGGIEDIIDDEGEESTEEGHEESTEESADEIIEEEDEEEEEGTDNSFGKGEIPGGNSSEITPNESLGKSKGGLTFPEESSTPSSGRTEIIITIEDGKSDIKGWDGVLDEKGKDFDGIDKSFDGKGSDYAGIDTHIEDDKSDIKSLEGGINEESNDYEGIDKPQESVDKDYDKLDDRYGEGGYEG